MADYSIPNIASVGMINAFGSFLAEMYSDQSVRIEVRRHGRYEQIALSPEEWRDLLARFNNFPTESREKTKENNMSENDSNPPAADPAEDHKTPGGQPGDNTPEPTETETTIETPGGTTVTESPAESGSGE